MTLKTVLFLMIIGLLNFGENSFYDDYCWRDYDDEVPFDAIIGGMNRDATPIYICQAVYDFKLLPGKVLNNDKNCYITYQEEHAVNDSVQILCSKRPDKFEWSRVSYNEIKDIRNRRVLEAGYEKGFHTYIGRVITDEEVTVAKVTCWARDCEKLSIMSNGELKQFEKFDLLVYNLQFQDKE